MSLHSGRAEFPLVDMSISQKVPGTGLEGVRDISQI
jgi:hypothetical protein